MKVMEVPAQLQPFVRVVDAGGLRLHVYDAGGGAATPALLIHGLGDEADTWRHVLPVLARERRVIALDLPGFGRSDKPRRAYSGAFFARAAADLLGALGIARAVLVGHSMGAAVAQRLALARRGLAERLVLIGGALPTQRARPPAPLWLFLTPGLGELIYTSLRRSQEQAYATLRPYYHDLDALAAADQAFLRERVWARVWSSGQRRAFLSAFRWLAFEQGARADALRARLAELRVPTTLIWGAQDAIVPAAAGQAMAALLPQASFAAIEQCGHLPQQERPAQLLELLEKSLTN